MNASNDSRPVEYDRSEKIGGATYWAIAGALAALGLVTVNVPIDAVMIGVIQTTAGVDICLDRFDDSLLATVLAVSIATSMAFGYLLLRMRRQVASDPVLHDPRWAKHVRRWFTFAAFGTYLIAAPIKCLFMLGMAYC